MRCFFCASRNFWSKSLLASACRRPVPAWPEPAWRRRRCRRPSPAPELPSTTAARFGRRPLRAGAVPSGRRGLGRSLGGGRVASRDGDQLAAASTTSSTIDVAVASSTPGGCAWSDVGPTSASLRGFGLLEARAMDATGLLGRQVDTALYAAPSRSRASPAPDPDLEDHVHALDHDRTTDVHRLSCAVSVARPIAPPTPTLPTSHRR